MSSKHATPALAQHAAWNAYPEHSFSETGIAWSKSALPGRAPGGGSRAGLDRLAVFSGTAGSWQKSPTKMSWMPPNERLPAELPHRDIEPVEQGGLQHRYLVDHEHVHAPPLEPVGCLPAPFHVVHAGRDAAACHVVQRLAAAEEGGNSTTATCFVVCRLPRLTSPPRHAAHWRLHCFRSSLRV